MKNERMTKNDHHQMELKRNEKRRVIRNEEGPLVSLFEFLDRELKGCRIEKHMNKPLTSRNHFDSQK